jgi:hypothetical protein
MILGHAAGVVAAVAAGRNGTAARSSSAASNPIAVQDVDSSVVSALLRADGALLDLPAPPPPPPPSYGCQRTLGFLSARDSTVSSDAASLPIKDRKLLLAPAVHGGSPPAAMCLLDPVGKDVSHHGADSVCGGHCPPLKAQQWLALRAHWYPPSPVDRTPADGAGWVLKSRMATVLKKSEGLSQTLPAWAVQPVG